MLLTDTHLTIFTHPLTGGHLTFDQLDLNHDGMLSREEFSAGQELLRLRQQVQQLNQEISDLRAGIDPRADAETSEQKCQLGFDQISSSSVQQLNTRNELELELDALKTQLAIMEVINRNLTSRLDNQTPLTSLSPSHGVSADILSDYVQLQDELGLIKSQYTTAVSQKAGFELQLEAMAEVHSKELSGARIASWEQQQATAAQLRQLKAQLRGSEEATVVLEGKLAELTSEAAAANRLRQDAFSETTLLKEELAARCAISQSLSPSVSQYLSILVSV